MHTFAVFQKFFIRLINQSFIHVIFFLTINGCIYGQLYCESNYSGGKNQKNLVSMSTFLMISDFQLLDRQKYKHTFSPKEVWEGAVILVQTNLLPSFFANYHPKIENRYILLTQYSDLAAPQKKYEQFLDDPKIIKWLVRNPAMTHPKLIPIPIGIRNRYRPTGNPEIQFTKNQSFDKKHLVYINFQVRPGDRESAYKFFKKQDFCCCFSRKPFRDYLRDIAQSYFVISPEGKGLDCFRTWETLSLGSIPILKSSLLDPLFKDLPVVIINDWEEVTKDFLEQKYKEMQQKSFCLDVLYIDYWKDLINEIRIEEGIHNDPF